jgi:hypothetical protein
VQLSGDVEGAFCPPLEAAQTDKCHCGVTVVDEQLPYLPNDDSMFEQAAATCSARRGAPILPWRRSLSYPINCELVRRR